jgi:hypothetical protein
MRKLPGGTRPAVLGRPDGLAGGCESAPRSRRRAVVWLLTALLAATSWHQAAPVQAQLLTPESPEVRAAIQRGVKHLIESRQQSSSPGRLYLSALAIAKAGQPEHPKVQQALQSIKSQYGGQTPPRPDYEAVYCTSVAIMLLTTLDPQGYRNEIGVLTDYLLSMQRRTGTFSNPPLTSINHGDTSMTQYAVLAFWEAEKAGVRVAPERWQAVASWLLRTQRPDGGFAYNPEMPESPVTPSMTAGGLGSCYIIAARTGLSKPAQRPRDPNMPSALKPVEEKQAASANRLSLDVAALRAAIQRGDAWFAQHGTVDVQNHQYYYLYSFERYRSFREYVEGYSPPAPHWYDQAARFILAAEDPERGWKIDTDNAFAVLFLLRSTRQSLLAGGNIDPAGKGTLIGGRGLPLGVPELEMRSGKIAVKPLSGPAEELLDVLGNPNDERFAQAVEGVQQYAESADEKQLSPLVARLRQLAQNDDPAARAAAITALGRARNLDDVPLLIHALQDPDDRVSLAARDALRYISRKLEGFGLRYPATKAEKETTAKKWGQWYLAIRPDAELQP